MGGRVDMVDVMPLPMNQAAWQTAPAFSLCRVPCSRPDCFLLVSSCGASATYAFSMTRLHWSKKKHEIATHFHGNVYIRLVESQE